MTVVYLYNPFVGDIVQHVLDALEASVDCNPRPLRIIYLAPRKNSGCLPRTASGLCALTAQSPTTRPSTRSLAPTASGRLPPRIDLGGFEMRRSGFARAQCLASAALPPAAP